MGYNIQTKRSRFFNELSSERQEEFFSLKCAKVLPCVDNIYYSIFIKDDTSDNEYLEELIFDLKEKKQLLLVSHDEVPYFKDLILCPGGFNIYKFRLSSPELFDIFILDYLPNDETPRILIQIRAYGLWVYGYEKMLNDSYSITFELFKDFYPDVKFEKVRENRIDFCYHTNCISNPYKTFSDKNVEKTIKTEFSSFGFRGHFERGQAQTDIRLVKDYFSLGERSSNNIFVRIYNKGLEVVELAYKSFFFGVWFENGLINQYDKFCYEYAYNEKNFDYVHKAKLEFYILYGSNPDIKKKFEKALKQELAPLKYIEVNDGFMPEVTTVINIEFETKRKFYYYSDKFIDAVLKTRQRDVVAYQLQRLYKILDNRHVFLDYLTSKTLAFKDGEKYVDWWERVRRVKHKDVVVSDLSLVREYAKHLDKDIAVKRAVNAVSTVALYNNNLGVDFREDLADLMSNINDNTLFYDSYVKNKMKKFKRLKNMID